MEKCWIKKSEHIGNIIVHPDNSDVIYVSAYGPYGVKVVREEFICLKMGRKLAEDIIC